MIHCINFRGGEVNNLPPFEIEQNDTTLNAHICDC